MRTTVGGATGALLAVVLAACVSGGPQDSAAPPSASASPSPVTAPTGEADATASPTTGADTGDIVLDASCEVPAPDDVPSVTLHHPAGWHVGGGDVQPCTFFSPDDPDLEPNTEPQGVDVRWAVEPAPFERVIQSDRATRDQRHVRAVVDGRRAMRTSAVSTGQALLPEGVRTTMWAVDLSRSADGDATLVGTVHDTGGVDYSRATEVLDAMARRAAIGGQGNDVANVTVARWPGRNAFTVAYRADDQCLELYAGQRQGRRLDQVCGVASAGELAPAILRGDGLEVAAGLAASEVDVVRLRGNTDAQRAAATVGVPGGARAFALPLSGTEATLIAETFDGKQLATHEVRPQ